MKFSTEVIHSEHSDLRKHVRVILNRPECGGNVGAVARAISNMGVLGPLTIVGDRSLLDAECYKFAMHAHERLHQAVFCESLSQAIGTKSTRTRLVMGTSCRVGSSSRPHPLDVRNASKLAVSQLESSVVEGIDLVFGSEGSGLSNLEIAQCDWVVKIPTEAPQTSLNLAQAVLVFCYEVHRNLLELENRSEDFRQDEKGQHEFSRGEQDRDTQRQRLVHHIIQLAETTGFILPGDLAKMEPRLIQILSYLPHHIPEARLLHGFIDQTIRSLQKGRVDFKGRFLKHVESQTQVSV